MIEQGEADVIVLWKWSRLSRARLDWAVAVDRIESLGGRIESATEPVDTSTASGRFARGMLAEFAAFESERIGDVWRETRERRIRNGLPGDGRARFGYSYSRERGYEIDPASGPVLAQLYRAYINGHPTMELIDELNVGPHRIANRSHRNPSGRWGLNTLMNLLKSGFGAGLIVHHGAHLPGAHDAVISPAEWEAFNVIREQRANRPRAERSTYLLSGIIRCHCGAAMAGANQMDRGRARPVYRCTRAMHDHSHVGGSIVAHKPDTEVKEWLVGLRERLNEKARQFPAAPAAVVDPAAALRRRHDALNDRLDAMSLRLIGESIPLDSYERIRDQIVAERDGILAELRRTEVRSSVRPVVMITDLLSYWDRTPLVERRQVLRLLVAKVVVYPPGHVPRVVVDSPFDVHEV